MSWRALVDDPSRRQELETRIRELADHVARTDYVFDRDRDRFAREIADSLYSPEEAARTRSSNSIGRWVRYTLMQRAADLHKERSLQPPRDPANPMDPDEPTVVARLERLQEFFNEPGQARELLRLYLVERLTVTDIANRFALDRGTALMELWRSWLELRQLLKSLMSE